MKKKSGNLNLTSIGYASFSYSSHLFDLGAASKAAFVSTNDGPSTAQEFISNIHYYAIHSCCAKFKKKNVKKK